eukprot:403363369
MHWKKRKFLRLVRQLMQKKSNEAAIVAQSYLRSFLARYQVQRLKYHKAFVLNIDYFFRIKTQMQTDAQILIAFHYRKYAKYKKRLIKRIEEKKVNSPYRKAYKETMQAEYNVNMKRVQEFQKQNTQKSIMSGIGGADGKRNGLLSKFKKQSNSNSRRQNDPKRTYSLNRVNVPNKNSQISPETKKKNPIQTGKQDKTIINKVRSILKQENNLKKFI